MSPEQQHDKLLKCVECGTDFPWTIGEQKFYSERDFTPPKRCKRCRDARKAKAEKEAAR
jgi:hypothetical protein